MEQLPCPDDAWLRQTIAVWFSANKIEDGGRVESLVGHVLGNWRMRCQALRKSGQTWDARSPMAHEVVEQRAHLRHADELARQSRLAYEREQALDEEAYQDDRE